MATKNDISVVIIARNEQDRIVSCAKSVAWAGEVILIDNNSNDKTVQLATPYVTKIVGMTSSDFSALRMAGMAHAHRSWILYVDADEQVPNQLRNEVLDTIQKGERDGIFGYYLKRTNYYLGHLWPIEDKMQRLFLRAKLKRWEGALHETAIIDGVFATLNHSLVHMTHRSLEEMVDKTNAWSEVEARLRLAAHHPAVAWWRLIRVSITGFWDSFILKRGFAAGTVGWIESIYQAFSLFITYAKLWELQHKKTV